MYFYPHNDLNVPENWKSMASEGYKFDTKADAAAFMLKNRKLFDFDDKAVDYHPYDATRCPHCMEETARRDAVQVMGAGATIEMYCTTCNARWRDSYIRKMEAQPIS